MYSKGKKDLVSGSFLPFSLIAQKVIASICAVYAYYQGDMALATFYLAVASMLILALGVFYISDRQRLAKFLLTGTLICGFFPLNHHPRHRHINVVLKHHSCTGRYLCSSPQSVNFNFNFCCHRMDTQWRCHAAAKTSV